jgi:hypothetical protein
VRIVMTMLVRDEVDIVGACIRHHLDRGIEFIVATDHGSTDGTSDVLAGFEREGVLRVIRREGEIRQSEWVTAMARLAATEHGADWVVNVDADEFWWPRSGTIPDVLAAVPARFGAVRALMRHFVPRPVGPGPFQAQMVVRRACDRDQRTVFHSQVKIAHRGQANVWVTRGNHDVYGDGLALLRDWFPLEVLHFPVRDIPQMAAKFSRRTDTPAPSVVAMQARIAARGVEAVFESLCVSNDQLAAEVERGSVAVDLRLSKAFRCEEASIATLPPAVSPETQPEAERTYVADIAAFMHTDSVVVLERRLNDLERALGTTGSNRWKPKPTRPVRSAPVAER